MNKSTELIEAIKHSGYLYKNDRGLASFINHPTKGRITVTQSAFQAAVLFLNSTYHSAHLETRYTVR